MKKIDNDIDRVQSFHMQSQRRILGVKMVWQDHQCRNKGDNRANGSIFPHHQTPIDATHFWSHLPNIRGYTCFTPTTLAVELHLSIDAFTGIPSATDWKRPLGHPLRTCNASTGGRRYGSTHQCPGHCLSISHLHALCFVLCVSLWAVDSATGLSVLWNTFSRPTFIFHVVLFVTCVMWDKMNEWMNLQPWTARCADRYDSQPVKRSGDWVSIEHYFVWRTDSDGEMRVDDDEDDETDLYQASSTVIIWRRHLVLRLHNQLTRPSVDQLGLFYSCYDVWRVVRRGWTPWQHCAIFVHSLQLTVVVLETRVLVSRRLETRFQSLGLLVVFGHQISVRKWRRTFVTRGRHKALFINLCRVLIVESLNGDQLYLDH